MGHGSRICGGCGALNAVEDPKCHRCGRPLGGARGGAANLADTPYLATRILLGICVVNFVLLVLDHGGLPMTMFRIFGTPPSSSEMLRWGGLITTIVAEEPWRLLSAVFMHLDPLHLAMNMLGVLSLCQRTEHRVGGPRMVIAFTVTGIAGFLGTVLWEGTSIPYPTAGASGALFGLMGHEFAHMHMGRDPSTRNELFQFGAYALAYALLFPVNNSAHLTGLATGYVVGRVLVLDKRPWRWARLYQGVAGLCIVASVASLVLCHRSTLWQRMRAYEVMHAER